MRILIPAMAAMALLAGPGLVQPAVAQTTTAPAPPASIPPAAPPPPASSPGTSVPETTDAPAPASAAPTPKAHKTRHASKRVSMHQRFATANTSQDGHLTLDQARGGKWAYAVRNFSAIDRDHKGYITEADIHAFAHARYMARHAAAGAPAAASPTPAPTAPAPAQ